jgi:diguanylate cyclase (GGDEF)-like protein
MALHGRPWWRRIEERMPRDTQRPNHRENAMAPPTRLPVGGHADATLRDLVAGAEIGIGFLNTNLRYVQGNAALAAAFGVASVINLKPSDLGAAGSRTEALLRKVLRSGRPTTLGAGGQRMAYHRVLDDDGTPVGISVVSATDTLADLDVARLKLEAETDGLTGLVNHRVFQERLRVEVSRSHRHGRPLSLAMVDIDGFKQLNDTFGHQVGDDVLAAVAGHLTACVRTSDTVARIGGDEFAMLLPETDAGDALTVAERVHDRLRRDSSNPDATVTISTGLCDMEYADTADDLIRFADGALFWTKGNGRNAICRYRPDLVEDLSAKQRGDRLLRNKALVGIRSLARAIDARDHSTLLHSERVASLAGRLAEAMQWLPDRVVELREVALIHDVGKIGVPEEVLLKPASLTPAEYEIVKTHVTIGSQIASEVLDTEQAAWLRAHHENFDGSGYPDGLAGNAIPDGAAILRLADSWDVMTSDRPYSVAMSPTQAIAECQDCAARQFDPEVVAVLTRPGFERVLRMFANEQATRDRNEARLVGATEAVLRVYCECGADECEAMIDISASDYRAVRLADRRYIVKAGHEIPEIEETLVTTETYKIVEKG